MADEQAAPSSIIPPAEEKHDAPKETVLGEDKPEEPKEGVPVSTSGPVSEDKIRSALDEIPAPKTDLPGDDAHKVQAEKELKEKSPVGGSEVEAVEGSGGKPHEMKTVEQAQKEKEEEKKESGEGEKEEEGKEGKEETEANGPAADEKNEEEKETGDKRGAAAVTNGGGAEEPAGKKAKKAEGAPTTNGGGAGPRGSKAKNKREPAPVGKTARRTRSQGLTES